MSARRGGGDGPRPLGEALDRVVRGLSGERAAVVATVFDRWDELVGEALAAHVRPVSLERGRLVVAADDPAWASQVRWLQADVLARLALVDASVTQLEVRVRPR
ncbi:MAG: DciA family protein [Acidimicrobiales bacterium]